MATVVVAGAAATGAVVTTSQHPAAAAATRWSSDGYPRVAPGWRGGPGGQATNGVSGSPASPSTATAATASEEAGVVDITVVLDGTEEAAGTGMVLTSDGEILTNRHVVQGETSISVTVAATGRSYAARVVGISTTNDVAVVQLKDAAGLTPVRTASGSVQVGDAVTGVGNAGGTGGTPSAVTGTVTALRRSITASDDDGSNPERLTGLIETDADIQAGDSGGPLLNASGAVIGMDTAASSSGDDGYAIPIATALRVAQKIEDGAAGTRAGSGSTAGSTGSTFGSTSGSTSGASRRAYLGVEVITGSSGGVQVVGVVPGSPAASAGLAAGDTITSVAGRRVTGAGGLASVMSSVTAGHRVTVSWTDTYGRSHTARVITAGI